MKSCRPREGVDSIPGGAAFYQQCLKFHTSLDITPREVHEIGLVEVARIRKEMERVEFVYTVPLNVSCFSKIQISFAFLIPAYLSSPGKRAVKRLYVCMFASFSLCVCMIYFVRFLCLCTLYIDSSV